MSIQLSNSGWTWWTWPRATYCNGLTYVSSVRDNGYYGFDVIAADNTVRRIILNAALEGPPGDDHNNPAIVAVAGKPLLLFYSEHNVDRYVRWYVMPWNGDQAPVQGAIPTPAASGWGTVVGPTNNFATPLPDPTNNTIHLFSTVSNRYQGYARSENWGTDFSAQSLNLATYWLDFGATYNGSSNSFGFVWYRQLPGNPEYCRCFCAAGYESGRQIVYCEMNLATGDILNSSGTVLGNLRTGANLPLLDTDLELVYQVPSGKSANYAYDVLGGTNPEVLFGTQDLTNPDTASAYFWGTRSGTTWSTEQIVAAGPRFTTSPSIGYFAGAQFLNSQSVLLSRATTGSTFTNGMHQGNWQLENWVRQSPGVWTPTVLQTDPTYPLIRAFPVEGNGPFTYVYGRTQRYPTYNDFTCDLHIV